MNEKKILELLRASKARALHVAEICTQLQIPKSHRPDVTLILERMAEEQLVTQLPGAKFRIGPVAHGTNAGPREKRTAFPATDPTPGLTGRLSMHPRGFGFVTTVEPGPDVFITPQHLGAAMHGDRVGIRAWRSRQGMEGEVLAVVERAHKVVGGTLQIEGTQAWIEPDDNRMRGPMRLAEPPPQGAKTGTPVMTEITRYPTRLDDAPSVRIIEMLSDDRLAEFEIRKILLRDMVATDFAVDVLEQAKTIPEAVPAADIQGREDLRHLPLIAIDPVDARDHDDAVWAEKTTEGYRVIVAIADVSHYVREGTAIDREAVERGCTIYLPDRAIPMLPRELSSNLASLLPNVDRLTLAVEVHLDHTGDVIRKRYIDGVMRSPATLFYEGVARALGLADDVAEQPATAEHLPLLRTLFDVAQLLNKRRRERGALEMNVPEAKVRLESDTGNPSTVERSRKNAGVARAYNIVEELMLLANETVADDLAQRGVPVMYRVHGAPDPERIEMFAEVATSLGYPLDADSARNPKTLAAFLRTIEGTPHASTLGYLLLRAMQQATYDVVNIGHFGLGATAYAHFTSPIRRYPDLTVHRVVRSVARGERIDVDALKTQLQAQAVEASRLERRAMKIERETVDLYRALLMRDRIGDRFEGQITGIAEHGLFVSLDDPFVEVLVRYTSLGSDRFAQDAHGLRVFGERSGVTYGLGDRVALTIEDVVVARRQIVGVLDGTAATAQQPGGKRPPARAPQLRLQVSGDTRGDNRRGEQQRKRGNKPRGGASAGAAKPTGKPMKKRGRKRK